MELATYLKILRKYSLFIFCLTLLGLVLGFYSTRLTGDIYKIEKTYYLKINHQQNMDSSEAIFLQGQASAQTDTAVAFLDSREFQIEALDPQTSISTRKLAPQLIRLTYTNPDPNILVSDVQKLPQRFKAKLDNLAQTDQTLAEISNSSMPQKVVINNKLTATIGASLAILASLLLIGLREYLKI